MKNFIILLSLIVGLVLAGCGKEAEEAMEIMKDLPEKAEQVQKKVNRAEERIAERKKKGDTIAIPYKKLQEYLPASIEGYTTREPSGEQMSMGGFSFSQAERIYEGKSNDGENIRLRISLVDYVENYGMYAGLAFWLSGYSREDEDSYEKTFDTGVDDVFAMESYKKKGSNRAEVTYAVGYRFLLQLQADHQKDTEFLKSVAKKIDIKKLSKM